MEKMEQQVHLQQVLVRQVQLVLLGQLDRKVQQVHKVQLVHKDQQVVAVEELDLRDQKVKLELLVQLGLLMFNL
jgi:hypothetical protein